MPETRERSALAVIRTVAEDVATEIARLTAELDAARERERGYREALEHIAADRWTMDVRCIGMMRDAARRALASTPPDTEDDDA